MINKLIVKKNYCLKCLMVLIMFSIITNCGKTPNKENVHFQKGVKEVVFQ
jgi:hypothetical protein